jgi:hypothetical protein
MAVREQQTLPVSLDEQLVGRPVRRTRDQVMIAVHVGITRPFEATRDLRVSRASTPQLSGRIPRQASGQRFPDVTEQHDSFEVPLEEGQKAQELTVVVAKPVGPAAATEVKIRNYGYFHAAPACVEAMTATWSLREQLATLGATIVLRASNLCAELPDATCWAQP